MKALLICDAGATKTDWILLPEGSREILHFKCKGINPVHSSDFMISSELIAVRNSLPAEFTISDIRFFGAGCATYEIRNSIQDIINSIWPEAKVYVESDLMGAALALFGNESGIACILGTGSNSCFFEHGKIKQQIPSLGYILGDEGSGSAIGKRLISDIFKEQLPNEIREAFFQEFQLTLSELIEKVYKNTGAAAFLASYAPFVLKNLNKQELFRLAYEEIDKFFIRNVCAYTESHSFSVGLVGSIAFCLEDMIKEICCKRGLILKGIIKSPAERLADYFTNQNIDS